MRLHLSANATGRAEDVVGLSGRAAYAVGWCGMRGIVTLAAALALPVDFPWRDLIFFTSFSVVLVTLVVQGMTLRPLISWLGLQDDGSVDREVRLARVETLRAGVDAVSMEGRGVAADLLRRRYELRLRKAEGTAEDAAEADDEAVALAAAAAERRRLIELRDSGTIGDAAFQRVEQELDLRELSSAEVLSE